MAGLGASKVPYLADAIHAAVTNGVWNIYKLCTPLALIISGGIHVMLLVQTEIWSVLSLFAFGFSFRTLLALSLDSFKAKGISMINLLS